MRKSEIEAWALRVVDQVNAKQPNEDAYVELKAEWPADHYKAARRIAGHANAAHGEFILWLIGVNERSGVIGAARAESASWYAQVQSHFDGLAPSVTDLDVPVAGQTVVALLFDTSRAPFVINTKEGGSVSREVPWREATRIDSARRDQLIRILAPLQRMPRFEVLEGWINQTYDTDFSAGYVNRKLQWQVTLKVYAAIPHDVSRVAIPFHRCRGSLRFVGENTVRPSSQVWITNHGNPDHPIAPNTVDYALEATGVMYVHVSIPSDQASGSESDAFVTLELHTADSELPAVLHHQVSK